MLKVWMLTNHLTPLQHLASQSSPKVDDNVDVNVDVNVNIDIDVDVDDCRTFRTPVPYYSFS